MLNVLHYAHVCVGELMGGRLSMLADGPLHGLTPRQLDVLICLLEGETEKEDQVVVREDFWTSTSNKQLNFVQHIYTLLKIDGRAAMWQTADVMRRAVALPTGDHRVAWRYWPPGFSIAPVSLVPPHPLHAASTQKIFFIAPSRPKNTAKRRSAI